MSKNHGDRNIEYQMHIDQPHLSTQTLKLTLFVTFYKNQSAVK